MSNRRERDQSPGHHRRYWSGDPAPVGGAEDYTESIRISEAILKRLSRPTADPNTSRCILGNLFDFDRGKDTVPTKTCGNGRWALHHSEIHSVSWMPTITSSFTLAFYTLHNSARRISGALYLDVLKAVLYIQRHLAGTSLRPRTAITIILSPWPPAGPDHAFTADGYMVGPAGWDGRPPAFTAEFPKVDPALLKSQAREQWKS